MQPTTDQPHPDGVPTPLPKPPPPQAYSGDGATLAAGSNRGEVCLWDVAKVPPTPPSLCASLPPTTLGRCPLARVSGAHTMQARAAAAAPQCPPQQVWKNRGRAIGLSLHNPLGRPCSLSPTSRARCTALLFISRCLASTPSSTNGAPRSAASRLTPRASTTW